MTNVILFKTTKAVAVVNDKKLNAKVFFNKGSQCSYVPTEFANQLSLTPKSDELLSVSGYGGTFRKQNIRADAAYHLLTTLNVLMTIRSS